jgi:RNA polymerase sigma factor (sigma-70 family)
VNNTIGQQHSDKYLVDKVLGGDSQTFAVIIRNTEPLVAQIVCKMIAGAEDRKDLAQDVYLKVFRNLSGFRFQSKLSTWIAQIAYNTCFTWLEKKKLLLASDLPQADEQEDAMDWLATGTSAAESITDTMILNKELSHILLAETDKLSPIHKTLITLYHQEDMSYDEIGQITGLPAGTVKSYLFRARKALKDRLLRHYKKDEL